MKKILVLMALVASAISMMAQSYDQLKDIISPKVITTDTSRITNALSFDELKVSITRTIDYGNWRTVKSGNWLLDLNGSTRELVVHHSAYETVQLPEVIYDEYMLGKQLSTAGIPFISIGLPICIVGTIFACSTSQSKQTAGTALLGIGGTMVSISLPLLCFGDHLKRTANKDYMLYTYF